MTTSGTKVRAELAGRLDDWLDVVSDLLRQPILTLPRERVAHLLTETYDGVATSWCAIDRQRRVSVAIWPDGFLPGGQDEDYRVANGLGLHPLLRWFRAVAAPRSQCTDLVPAEICDPNLAAAWREAAGPYAIAHQIAIPLIADGVEFHAFTVVRPVGGYDGHDVALADRLRRLLAAADRQASALAGFAGMDERELIDLTESAHLTPRQLAVLQLLATGLTADGIARRLMISPRTVQKHLDQVYAKLRARDRLSAVLRAAALGLIGGAGPDEAAIAATGRAPPRRGGTATP